MLSKRFVLLVNCETNIIILILQPHLVSLCPFPTCMFTWTTASPPPPSQSTFPSLLLHHGKPLIHFQSCTDSVSLSLTHPHPSLSPSLSLSFSMVPLAKPAIRSHAMCSLSSRRVQLFAGGTHAGAWMNSWHSGDLPGCQWAAGVEGCFGRGCHGLLLCHSSGAGMLSPGQNTAKGFGTSYGHTCVGIYKEPQGEASDWVWSVLALKWKWRFQSKLESHIMMIVSRFSYTAPLGGSR